MEILLIVNLIISTLALVGVGIAIFKPRKSDIDTAEIGLVVSRAFSELGASLTASLGASVGSQIERVEAQIQRSNESGANNHLEILKTLRDSFLKITESAQKNNDAMLAKLEAGLEGIRAQVKERLDEIQKTVDEKLDATLSARLKASFDNVIKQIADINVAVGEIKTLASDVSSLNRVLTNVKTKGIVGEIALESIICELLTPEQYETNFVTKEGTRDPVEFAIKMPGSADSVVYLPIDAKFPLEDYNELLDASDALDKERFEKAKKALRSTLKQFAKKIHDKYIDPPHTTDCAIMFLPIEGLYAQALNLGLFDELQREYKITVAGPSTLSALLNALQMGFKSLAIQKRSSQVFELLGAVKTEFGRFSEVLAKAQKKFDEASEELEKLVGTRTRMINSKLREITALDDLSTGLILPPNDDTQQ